MDIDASPVLARLSTQASPALKPFFDDFAVLYDQKLWHQLTVRVEEFISLSEARPMIHPLYRDFIVGKWDRKMNPMSYVRVTIAAAHELPDTEALELLDSVASATKALISTLQECYVLIAMEAAQYRLRAGDLESTKKAIDECTPIVNSLIGAQSSVKAAYYRVCAAHARADADFSRFYRDALLYLACLENDVPVEERCELAHDLAVSALLGETYNLGELLLHPIVQSLQGETSYILGLLQAVNSGDHDAFNALIPSVKQHPLLGQKVDVLQEKVMLMSLIDVLARKPVVAYDEIAGACRVENVPLLVMRALSLQLAKGHLDQVKRVVEVDWVQPRVLSSLDSIEQALLHWQHRVASAIELLQSEFGRKQLEPVY